MRWIFTTDGKIMSPCFSFKNNFENFCLILIQKWHYLCMVFPIFDISFFSTRLLDLSRCGKSILGKVWHWGSLFLLVKISEKKAITEMCPVQLHTIWKMLVESCASLFFLLRDLELQSFNYFGWLVHEHTIQPSKYAYKYHFETFLHVLQTLKVKYFYQIDYIDVNFQWQLPPILVLFESSCSLLWHVNNHGCQSHEILQAWKPWDWQVLGDNSSWKRI